jgi:hypothetical protein
MRSAIAMINIHLTIVVKLYTFLHFADMSVAAMSEPNPDAAKIYHNHSAHLWKELCTMTGNIADADHQNIDTVHIVSSNNLIIL